MESYEEKINRIVIEIQQLPWIQPRQPRKTVGVRIGELLRKEFPDNTNKAQQSEETKCQVFGTD